MGHHFRKTDASGFTLVELVVTLIIVAILAAFALPRFFQRTVFDARSFFDESLALVRYAQKISVAQNRAVYVRLNGASVALCFDAACNTPVIAAATRNSGSATTLAACANSSTWACEGVPSNVAYTALNAAATNYVSANPSFYFNALGKPFNVVDVDPNTTFNSPLTVTVSGGGSSYSLTVERETGYVH